MTRRVVPFEWLPDLDWGVILWGVDRFRAWLNAPRRRSPVTLLPPTDFKAVQMCDVVHVTDTVTARHRSASNAWLSSSCAGVVARVGSGSGQAPLAPDRTRASSVCSLGRAGIGYAFLEPRP